MNFGKHKLRCDEFLHRKTWKNSKGNRPGIRTEIRYEKCAANGERIVVRLSRQLVPEFGRGFGNMNSHGYGYQKSLRRFVRIRKSEPSHEFSYGSCVRRRNAIHLHVGRVF